MSIEKDGMRTGSLAKIAESACDDQHSLEMPHSRYPCLAWKESVSGVGVRKATENFITDSGEHRLLRNETSSAGSLDSRRRRHCKSITACPAAAIVVVAVAIFLLVVAVSGLAFVISGLYDKVNDLETKIAKCAVENIARRKKNHEQRFESFSSAEQEGLFSTTMELINNDYDNDELELTTELLQAESTTSQSIGSDEEARDSDLIKVEAIHSRVRRDAVQGGQTRKRSSNKQLNQPTAAPPGSRGSQEKRGPPLLDTAHFEMDFYEDWYNINTNFSGSRECITDERWPTNPEACRGKTIQYRERDSPLAFYVPRNNTVNQSTGRKSRKRKNNNQSPMEITSRTEGVFGVRESGVYLIHLNITIVDESHTHSLGIFLNNQTVLTCPKGGFRCPDLNYDDTYKYRVCVIDGVLEINPGDRLQIKTMAKDTQVKFLDRRPSQFKAILLHKTRT